PKARYHSAGDLAADLGRWLDGRPIVARPVSTPTRIWRWSHRNPKLVATGAACLLLGAAAIWWYRGERVGPAEKSIAVLPIEDLDHDQESAAFAALLHANVVTQLTQLADLTVTASTSLQQY